MKIALLDDDEKLALTLILWLSDAGHDVEWYKHGRDCIHGITNKKYDLCLFDWMLPDMNGPEVMQHLKLLGSMPPVIFLTARDAQDDVVQVLLAGADDHIAKPPNKKILLSRIHALYRRSTAINNVIENFGNIQVNYVQHKFELDNSRVILTEKETFLALCLFKHINTLVSRNYLARVVWGSSTETNSRTIDVHISHLREKLKLTPENGWRLNCVNRQGYRLERLEN